MSFLVPVDPSDAWIHKLDTLVQNKWGFSFYDMPDCFFWIDLYEDGISPEDALEVCEVEWANHDPAFADLLRASEEQS